MYFGNCVALEHGRAKQMEHTTLLRSSVGQARRLPSVGILMTAIVTLVGCGGGGGGGSSPTVDRPAPPPTGRSFTINGVVTKGTFRDADIRIVDGVSPSTVLVSGRTSASDGSYSLTVPASANFEGNFVKVLVSGNAASTMICDAASGCGGAVGFGDPLSVDDSVSLSALRTTPAENATETVNVSAFTTLAAAHAESLGPLSTANITTANDQLTTFFDLGQTMSQALSRLT